MAVPENTRWCSLFFIVCANVESVGLCHAVAQCEGDFRRYCSLTRSKENGAKRLNPPWALFSEDAGHSQRALINRHQRQNLRDDGRTEQRGDARCVVVGGANLDHIGCNNIDTRQTAHDL